MVTIAQILAFADAVKEYRRERPFVWSLTERARRVVETWTAIDCGLLDRCACGDARAVVAAVNTLMSATTGNDRMQKALAAVLDEALVDLADAITEAQPEPSDADEEAAQ